MLLDDELWLFVVVLGLHGDPDSVLVNVDSTKDEIFVKAILHNEDIPRLSNVLNIIS